MLLVNIEAAAAAKVITELKAVIQDCPCNKEILDALSERRKKVKKSSFHMNKPKTITGPWKYSYPNFNVGNEEMGTGKNPGSLTWPFGVDNTKST